MGWVGALRREKNVARLLRAFAKLQTSSLRLVIAGDGPERENLKQMAAALQIADRVVWLGTRNDIAAILPAFDIFALSSDTEQMPISLIEAIRRSTPSRQSWTWILSAPRSVLSTLPSGTCSSQCA